MHCERVSGIYQTQIWYGDALSLFFFLSLSLSLSLSFSVSLFLSLSLSLVRINNGPMVLVNPVTLDGKTFVPCSYGYAMTIRRSQGSTLELGASVSVCW
jgi:hypothetical protein